MSRTFSPRVVGRHRPDFHCLESILASPQFAGRTGEELALAIYGHFTSTADGTYHFWPSSEAQGQPRIRRTVYDPVKVLNAYGWAICGQCAHMLYGLYTAGGLGARSIGLPGHSLCEVEYDGRWHILDVDMWTWFRTPAGHIAGAYELTQDPEGLILANTDKSDPCDLPDRSLEDYAGMYAKTETVDGRVKHVSPRWAIRAHTMDFRLRPGETLIRSQVAQGRFHVPEGWRENRAKYAKEWHGHPRERYEPFRTYGNGRWIYEPSLAAGSGDFQGGLWAPSDWRQGEGGLEGAGSAVWRIRSPYPFCGVPDDSGEEVTHSEGVWLELRGAGRVTAEVTDPHGRWAEVLARDGAGPFEARVDITSLLSSRYDCLLRVSGGGGSELTRLRFEGFILTAPMSIPRLEEGDNPMELRCGDKHGLCTVPWSEVVDFRSSADLAGRWHRADGAELIDYREGWRAIAPAGDGPVRVVFRFDVPTPLSAGFGWAYVHGSFSEGPPEGPRGTARLEWSRDGRRWRELAAEEISNTHLQWDWSLDGEVRFPKPVKAVYVRVTSDTAISGLEFHGHLLEEPATRDGLRIVHRWREGEVEKAFEPPTGADRYVIRCGPEPACHTVEMSCPSG
ncbi:MAG: discoidin domain-containing protein [Planctomycetota bacterium]|jgi:hypothetical protein